MSMQLPHRNQQVYRTAMYPNFGLNYNQYYSPFCSNSNGLLPTPLPPLMPPSVEQRANVTPRDCRPLLSINPFSLPPKAKSDFAYNDFFTFLEQKSRPATELNPFANEFSLVKTNHNQIMPVAKETNSSYKVIFDDLVEQSLQSIDAIKKASKLASVTHVSTQCDPSIDQIHRSTQTSADTDQHAFLKPYSSQAVRLINQLHDHVAYLLSVTCEHGLRHQLKLTNHLCAELGYLVSTINQTLTSGQLPLDDENLEETRSIRSSSMMIGIEERIDRSIASTPRWIDPITIVTSKICLLCQKPVDDSDDVMHKLCRLLSSPQAMNV